MKPGERVEVNRQGRSLGPRGAWPKVAIIVLNWNGWRDTIECLESLQRITYPNYQTIVVENGSTDDSLEKIRSWARGEVPPSSQLMDLDMSAKPLKLVEFARVSPNVDGSTKVGVAETCAGNPGIVLIRCEENAGYGGGNNVGIEYALSQGTDFVLVLNNDVVVEQGFLGSLVEAACDAKVGVVGPAIYSYAAPGQLVCTGMKMNFWLGRGIQIASRNVDYLMGSCLLIAAETVTDIGGFYAPYFLNFEDAEFCLKAGHAGWKVVYEPKSKVWHKSHGALGKVSHAQYYSYRNKLLFMKRNGPRPLKYAFLAYYSVYLVVRYIQGVFAGDGATPIWRALCDFWQGKLGKRTVEPHV